MPDTRFTPEDLPPFFPDLLPRLAVPGNADVRSAEPVRRYQRKQLSVKLILLDSARAGEEHPMSGTLLWAVDASSFAALLEVQFNDDTSGRVPFRRGLSIGGMPFDKLLLSNDAQPGEWIKLLYCVDSPEEPLNTDD